MLDLAARVAVRGAGLVEPNPMVGAVLVRAGRVIGLGHHTRYGCLHAEREAIANGRARGHDLRGSTLYCTLEPCCHHGKQPPCTDAVLEAGIAKVVYARRDPHADSGGGGAVLAAGGVEVELCLDSPLATHLSDPFVRRVRTGCPWVIAKWAQTIDGRIATRTGQSQWISSERSRRRVHRLRARVDVIMTGTGTVLSDDPMLTGRGVRRVRRVATRVVVDSKLRTPIESQLVRTARDIPTIFVPSVESHDQATALNKKGATVLDAMPDNARAGVDIARLLRTLGDDHAVSTVLIEAGPTLLGSMLRDDLIDEAVVHVAPMLLGDADARPAMIGRAVPTLSDARRFRLIRHKRVGDDIELVYRRKVEP